MKYAIITLSLIIVPLAGTTFLLIPASNPTNDETNVAETKDSVVDRIAGIGYVEPASELRRLVFQREGVLDEIRVQVGQSVKTGHVVAALQNDEELAAVELARRQLGRAKAERDLLLAGVHQHEITQAEKELQLAQERLAHAKREYDRLTSLRNRNAASESTLDEATSLWRQAEAEKLAAEAHLEYFRHFVREEDVALADAKLLEAEANLELAEKRHFETYLRAPQDGLVLEILKREGDGTLSAHGDPVLIFANLDRLRVRAEVDERFIYLLDEGLPVEVTARGLGDRRFCGTISRVNAIMGPKTVFSRASDERVDLEVVQVLIDMEVEFEAPVGMRVDVYISIVPDGQSHPNTDGTDPKL